MNTETPRQASRTAALVFNLLDPIPFGFFVAALIFDITYSRSGELLWMKSAAWLIAAGLLFAIPPRLINLARTWLPGNPLRHLSTKPSFFLNLLAIVAAIVNAFVHSRDAYGVMPEGMWLSVVTVALLVVANLMLSWQLSSRKV